MTQDYLKSILEYNPSTGDFQWKEKRGSIAKGYLAGRVNQHGYVQIGIDGKRYQAHRLAWLYVHGELPDGWLDHKDGDKTNNRIGNLRIASVSQNHANRPAHSQREFKGVFRTKGGKFKAQIYYQGSCLYLGTFLTEQEASNAYNKKSLELYGEFAYVR